MILLDTCTLLWLAADQGRLSRAAVQAIGDAGDSVDVSAISAWEICWKQAKGHLDLKMEAGAWFDLAIEVHRVRIRPITSGIAVRAAGLPRIHDDPADRFIIATAQEHGLAILTPDQNIHQYPDLKVVW